MGRNAGGEVTPTPKSFGGGAPDSQASRCGYLVLWSPETPCPPAPGRAVQAAVTGQRSLPPGRPPARSWAVLLALVGPGGGGAPGWVRVRVSPEALVANFFVFVCWEGRGRMEPLSAGITSERRDSRTASGSLPLALRYL